MKILRSASIEKIFWKQKRAAIACGPFVAATNKLEPKVHEQPLKSVRATVVTVADATTRAALLMSVVVMISEGEQLDVPPLFGTAARASTVNGTGAGAGTE